MMASQITGNPGVSEQFRISQSFLSPGCLCFELGWRSVWLWLVLGSLCTPTLLWETSVIPSRRFPQHEARVRPWAVPGAVTPAS